jgi:G:T-mismatch repair DNA endonuclease (very short patch repair protein)
MLTKLKEQGFAIEVVNVCNLDKKLVVTASVDALPKN